MHKNTILLLSSLWIISATCNYYSLSRFSTDKKCATSFYHIILEFVADPKTCYKLGCFDNGGSHTGYISRSCGADEKAFNASLLQYGIGQNFSVVWYYRSNNCNNVDVIDAVAVNSCEGAEQLDCHDGFRTQKCLYIPAITPSVSTPVPAYQPWSLPPVGTAPIAPPNGPHDQPIAPRPLAPKAIASPAAPVPISAVPIVPPTVSQTTGPDAAGNQRPFTQSRTNDFDTNVIYVVLAAIVILIASIAVCFVVKRKSKKNEKLRPNPDESQHLLSGSAESDVDDIKGHGSYSIVKQVTKDGKKYALKKILTGGTDLYDEYKILRKLDHPNILKVYEFTALSDSMPGIRSEDCDCALADIITSLTDLEILSYIKQLATALRYIQFNILGSHAVIHGDINPRNILFIEDHNIAKYSDVMLLKLADFGLARLVRKTENGMPSFSPAEDEEPYKSRLIDIWTAPDIEFNNTYSFFTDLYSFAIVCAQIILREMIEDLETLNDRLIEIKTRAALYAGIASFCLEIIDYKFQMTLRDPSTDKKLPANNKKLTTAVEVKAKLEEFKRIIAMQERMLSEKLNNAVKEKPEM